MRREEYKFPIDGNHRGIFPIVRALEPLFVEHGSRRINSVYFDDVGLECFHQGEEGLTPRRKVRARWYGIAPTPTTKADIRYELKFTYHHDREKHQYLFDETDGAHSPHGWARDIINGALRPVCKVSYDREYYKSHLGIRVTVDRNIRYSVSNGVWDEGQTTVLDDMSVIEVKCAEHFICEDIYMYIPSVRQRFSKYSRAVIMLNLAR